MRLVNFMSQADGCRGCAIDLCDLKLGKREDYDQAHDLFDPSSNI